MVECGGGGGVVGGDGIVSMCMVERVGRRGTVDGKADVGAVQPQSPDCAFVWFCACPTVLMTVGYDRCLYGYTGMWYCVGTDQVKSREGERERRGGKFVVLKSYGAHIFSSLTVTG